MNQYRSTGLTSAGASIAVEKPINMASHKITSLATPTNAGDATTKAYVDAKVGTVTSIGVSSTDFAVSGSPVTTAGSITLDLNTSGTAGTYTSVTVNSKGIVTAGTHKGVDLGEFAVGSLPSASANANCYALATDASGGRTAVRSNGTNWKVIAVEGATVST